jgi:hypothetical protein
MCLTKTQYADNVIGQQTLKKLIVEPWVVFKSRAITRMEISMLKSIGYLVW